MTTTEENQTPRERVVHEREIVTERERSPLATFFAAVAALALVAILAIVVWVAVDDDESATVDDVRQELDDTVDDVREDLDDAGDAVLSEADEVQDDLTDGQ